MDDRQVDAGKEEDGKSGVPEVCEEEEREVSGPESGGAVEGGRRGGVRRRARESGMERKEAEASFGTSPPGPGGVRRFLEGELVEVRQRERGLRGSWHPAVVIGVKKGRRVVEYDELLTDDGKGKLTESIPLGRCLGVGRLGSARQPWKSPSKRFLTLLRPRPPPLPDPSLTWSKGLCVDCYFKDAWWEGVLTETVSDSSSKRRAEVWFAEEEDWTAMPLREMRVGQQWDEDTGAWSVKGCVDIPVARRTRRPKTMSLSQKSRGFARSRGRKVRGSMKLAIALKMDDTSISRKELDDADAWNQTDSSKDDADALISVQLNSPESPAFSLRQAGTHRFAGDSSKEQNLWPLALRTRSSELFPQPLRSRSPSGRTRGDPSLCAGPSFGEESDNVAGRRNGEVPVADGEEHLADGEEHVGVVDGFRIVKENLDGVKLAIFRERRPVGAENGSVGKDAVVKVGQPDIKPKVSPDQEKGVKQLIASGWTITRNFKMDGKTHWYYKSPSGCLLSSLASALGMRKRMEDYSTCGDEENPTLSDILSPKSRNGSSLIKSRSGNGITLKSSRRVASPSSVKEGGQEMDQLEPNVGEDVGEPVNTDAVPNSGPPPAGSNGTREPTNADSPVFSSPLYSIGKRSASEFDSEFIVEDGRLFELKRRKLQEFPAEQDGPRSLHFPLSNGGPVEDDSDGSGGGGAYVKNTPLAESKPLSKSFDDGPATETRSKKRACVIEGMKREQGNDLFNARRADDRSPFPDSSVDYEPRTKKIKIIAEASCPLEGKSKKSLAILQESSRKKGSTPHKGGDLKLTKKGAAHMTKSASKVKKGKKSRTPGRAGVRLEVLLSAPGSKVEGEGGELTRKRTLLSWLIDNGTVYEHEKVRYLHKKDHHCMLEGSVTRDGILCNCCSKIVTLSVFEAHAGSKLHRPSANIYLDSGLTLSDCQKSVLAVKTQSDADGQIGQTDLGGGSIDKSDDTCGICGDGGKLICCDHCPSTFHLTCMGLQVVPDGDWYCPNCRCASCGESQFDGDKSTFNDLTVIFCDQCECEYHVKCLRDRGLVLTSIPNEDFFCGDICGRIFQGLRSLVGICMPMEGGFSWTLLRSGAEDDRQSGYNSNSEINVEHDSKLSIALSVMQECFRPMIDPRTKIDIITHVLYNRRSDVSRLNFHGFYTILLERGDELISVATIRVHGARLAELPLVGTRFQYRRQGMCRKLMSAIEEMLLSLGVERLVLPAVPELLTTWTGAFGFQPMGESEKLQLMDLNIMAFPGTSILHKLLENVVPRAEAGLLPTVDQSTCAEIPQPRLQKEQPNASLAPLPVIAKRRPGRPPKAKGKITTLSNGLALAFPKAIVGARNLRTSGHAARLSDCPVASHYVTVKRGRGRPPKNHRAPVKPTDDEARLALAIVEAHEAAEAGRDAGYACSSPEGFLGKAVGVTQLSKDEVHQQDTEPLPTVIRRKRGRPPRARMTYNPANGVVLSTAGTSSQVDQVAGFHGGRIQLSTSSEEHVVEAAAAHHHVLFPERSPNDEKLTFTEARGDFEYGSSPAIVSRTATHSMREVKTPLWLVESPADDPLTEGYGAGGGTRTYERRRSGLSPQSHSGTPSGTQDDGSDGEPFSGHLDFCYDEDELQPAAERRFCYESVSVPIRTFPSQFASRGDHNTPPGTFIPVETIVVNSQPKGEDLDEFLVPESETRAHSERREQKCGGKLLLRLKLPKKKMLPGAACAVETSQPSPASSPIQLPGGGLLPPAFTVSEQISKEVSRFEQFDNEPLKQSESTMGSHCFPVPVS